MAGLTHGRDRGPCRREFCGHPEANHEHLHDREYCGLCGRNFCPGYLPPARPARSWLARLTAYLAPR